MIHQNQHFFEIMGYDEFKRQVEVYGPKAFRNHWVILDEAQYFRNITEAMELPLLALVNADRFLMLTGTAFVNDPDESALLSILFKGENEIVPPSAIETDVMRGKLSYYDPAEAVVDMKVRTNVKPEDFPTCAEHVIHVPMTWPQTLEYLMYRKSHGTIGPHKVHHGKRNCYNQSTRAVSNVPFYIIENQDMEVGESPKLRLIADNIMREKRFPTVIYSNYKDMGVHPIYDNLEKAIDEQWDESTMGPKPHMELLTGDTRSADRESIIEDYNKGKVQILLFTKAAQQGIDLHGSQTMHLTEPLENISMESQTKNRICRYQSHKNVDFNHVDFYKYISVFPKEITQREKNELQEMFVKDWLEIDPQKDPIAYKQAIQSVNVYNEMKKEIAKEKETIDQRMEKYNVTKQNTIQPYIDALKNASIERMGFKSKQELKKPTRKRKRTTTRKQPTRRVKQKKQ